MLRFALVSALLPAVAAAQPAPEPIAEIESDERLTARTMNDFMFGQIEHSFDLEAHASVSGLAGRQNGGRANVGGEIAWNAGVCRPLSAGGELATEREKADEQAQVSGSWFGGFCMPFAMNRMELIVRGDYELQPRLAALPVGQRARYTGFTVELRNTFVGWRSRDSEGAKTVENAILPLTISMGTYEQPMIDFGSVTFTMGAYRRAHRDGRALDLVPYAMRAAGPALLAAEGGMYLSATANEISPFRLTRTSTGSLGPFALDADFAAGLGWATLTDPPEGGMRVPNERFRDYDLFVDTTVRATKGDNTLALHLRRAFEPTYTDELLLDTRADLSYYRKSGKHQFLAGLFAATTRRMDHAGPIDTTPSGGLFGTYTYQGPAHTQLVVSGEVARSFYAALDDTLALDADWSAQLTASLAFGWRRAKPTSLSVATP